MQAFWRESFTFQHVHVPGMQPSDWPVVMCSPRKQLSRLAGRKKLLAIAAQEWSTGPHQDRWCLSRIVCPQGAPIALKTPDAGNNWRPSPRFTPRGIWMLLRSHWNAKRAFTLIELLIVISVLAILAGLVLSRFTGVTDEANTATNMNVIAGMNKAVETFETRYQASPATWDGLVPSAAGGGNALYSLLHPNLAQHLTVLNLDAGQAASLRNAGINGMMVVTEGPTETPSMAASTEYAPMADGTAVPVLVKPAYSGHGSTFIDRAFNVNSYNPGFDNEFIVLGVGYSSKLRGSVLHDVPIVQSAEPSKHYARVLCVYMIPPTGTPPEQAFRAQFVGSFLPDGTCMADNSINYQQARESIAAE
jgi:prepilin-type N-terminal cleavage/methylation domain-containing protein